MHVTCCKNASNRTFSVNTNINFEIKSRKTEKNTDKVRDVQNTRGTKYDLTEYNKKVQGHINLIL